MALEQAKFDLADPETVAADARYRKISENYKPPSWNDPSQSMAQKNLDNLAAEEFAEKAALEILAEKTAAALIKPLERDGPFFRQ